MNKIIVGILVVIFWGSGSNTAQITIESAGQDQTGRVCLPTGVCLDPAGRSFAVGNMPLAIVLSPEGDRLVISLSGWRQQGLQIIDRKTGEVTQTIAQVGGFLGLAFANDGRTLYASGGNEDAIYRYAWRDKQATLVDRIVLAEKEPNKDGTRFPAGIALSADGRRLYVAENLADTLAVIDIENNKIEQRLATEPYPCDVVVAPDGGVYVSAWGGGTVSAFTSGKDGSLKERQRIPVGRHPSALLLNHSGSRLFVASASTNSVAVVDTKKARVLTTLFDKPAASLDQGSTPNALALSQDGSRLYVAEADNNAIAVFDLSSLTAGVPAARGGNNLAGRIPVEWYPTALLMTKESLFVLNGKGRGTKPNPGEVQPDTKLVQGSTTYTLGQLNGTLTMLPTSFDRRTLRQFSRRVARANNWDTPVSPAAKYPPFKHVIYIIKENRTYDQIMADLPQGDGDPSLLFFPRSLSPNHHALAERFGLFDRFFVNAEVSSQGHVWSTAGYVTDYGEKTIPSIYASRRNSDERGDVDDPAAGYLWNAAIRKGLTLRNYGEFRWLMPPNKNDPVKTPTAKSALISYTSYEYPDGDLKISDQLRADAWVKEFQQFVRTHNLPAFEILHLLGDHTQGARPGRPTPKACMADHDFALGRIVEAVSNSVYWKDTVFFVLEDDAQDGPDHVDSHRSVLLIISAYNRDGVIHRFVNTTDVIATIEEILELEKLSHFDYFGRPLREIFDDKPDLAPYTALKSTQRFDELNPATGPNAKASLRLDLDQVDEIDEDAFNRILWSTLKHEEPYPAKKRMSSLEVARAR